MVAVGIPVGVLEHLGGAAVYAQVAGGVFVKSAYNV